jgi:predicted metal-dependent enzyme (double-stranded beta helix superfamily)
MLTTVAQQDARLVALAQSAGTSPEGYLELARITLRDLTARSDLLDGVELKRKPGGYARTLLFGRNGISVWAITWSPGSRTSVHDHHCSCCFGVWSGVVREVWFRTIGDEEAVPAGAATREPGYVACMMPNGPNLHQMLNSGADEAISIHVYGFDQEVHASSIQREYRIVAG